MEQIKIKNSKGQNIAAVVKYSTKPYQRLAVLCPGYLDTKDYAHLVALAEKLTEKGYTAVSFDPTGTWESGGDIAEYSNTQYLEDIRSVLEHMLKRENFTDILLGGHSRGGQLSILYAARDPRVSAVVAIMPSSGGVQGARREEWEKSGYSFSKRDLPDGKSGIKEFNVPFSHVLDRDQYDVIGDVKKIKAPIIFIAGELDEMCPPEEVKEIFDTANEPKKYIFLKNIGHNYRHSQSEIEIVNREIMKNLFPYTAIAVRN
ncbi:alpha/beta hydrolase [Acetobacteraceae bacterium]|nr:alpha/beta hydrolase [Candidatus Parcubacteria bacterium]